MGEGLCCFVWKIRMKRIFFLSCVFNCNNSFIMFIDVYGFAYGLFLIPIYRLRDKKCKEIRKRLACFLISCCIVTL